MKNSGSCERRSHERAHIEYMFIAVKYNTMAFCTAEPVMQIDISEGGVAVLTDKDASIGDKLLLDLVFQDKTAHDISGIVRSKKKVRDIHRLNIQFDKKATSKQKEKDLTNLITDAFLSA